MGKTRLLKFTVWVYPANSVIGGPIEERTVIEVLTEAVVYDGYDSYGYFGAKRDNVYFTPEQAEEARDHDN